MLGNRQLIRLQWNDHDIAIRLFIYKVTGSGRSAHERRVQITSTFETGLPEAPPPYNDIVLGYDPESDIFVGLDARRVMHGGATGNASSFVDPDGLTRAAAEQLLILPRKTSLFKIEYHAYFRPWKLTEYVMSAGDIHQGRYDGRGAFSKNIRVSRPARLTVSAAKAVGDALIFGGLRGKTKKPNTRDEQVWKAFEIGDTAALKKLKVTQLDFEQLQRRQIEIGILGEEHVLKEERKRLARAGRRDLASQVSWIAQSQPYEGYDIRSFDEDGKERFIEVKATSGTGRVFPITDNEWRTARVKGSQYFIYRVIAVEKQPKVTEFQNPHAMLASGKLKLTPLAWLIKY